MIKPKKILVDTYACIFSRINLMIESLIHSKSLALCQFKDFHYIGKSSDKELLRWMIARKKNWAQNEIEAFFSYSKEYYHDIKIDKDSIFIDVGANIGTTFIYFKKCLCNDIGVIAFEPDSDSYRFAQVNTILNGLNNVKIEKLGLGNKNENRTIYKHPENPGGNSIVGLPTPISESITTITLDDYLKKQEISRDSISFIWIDTEGYEPYVLLGAKELLVNQSIPILMELNPQVYKRFPGLFEEMMNLLEACYTSYIVLQDGSKHSLSDLWDIKNIDHQIGDIFLIK